MRGDPIDLQSPNYTPVRVLNETAFVLRVNNDSQLARRLELHQAVLTRIKKRSHPITETVFVRIMDRTGWGIKYTRELAGIPYEGIVYPPRTRSTGKPHHTPRNYQTAKDDILQAMPGTIDELTKRSGYSRGTVGIWVKVLRAGDPLTRGSHIIDWRPPNGRGPFIPVHQAGSGEDAICILRAQTRREKWRKEKCGHRSTTQYTNQGAAQ